MNESSTVRTRRARAAGRRAPRMGRAPRHAEAVRGPLAARVQAALRDHARVERLARTFKALGDPTRSKLVLALSLGELCVGELAGALGTSMSATSHQLRILRDLDIVQVRRSGKSQLYTLNEKAFGFCAPRSCHAWKQTLDGGALVALGTRAG